MRRRSTRRIARAAAITVSLLLGPTGASIAATLEVIDVGDSTSAAAMSDDGTVVAGSTTLATGAVRAWRRDADGVRVIDWIGEPVDPAMNHWIGGMDVSADGSTLIYGEYRGGDFGPTSMEFVVSRNGVEERLDHVFSSGQAAGGWPDGNLPAYFSADHTQVFGVNHRSTHPFPFLYVAYKVRHEPPLDVEPAFACPSSYVSPYTASGAGVSDLAGISRDGAIAIGHHGCTHESLSSSIDVAFMWGGSVVVHAKLPGSGAWFEGTAEAISGDGRVGLLRRSSDGVQVLWYREGLATMAIVDVPSLPGMPAGDVAVTHLSEDGSVLAGTYAAESVEAAFRWADGVFTPLGNLPPGTAASDVDRLSLDGSVISGTASAATYYWDEAGGMRTLEHVVAEHGVDTTGWALDSIQDWSPDGRRFVGRGSKDGRTVGYIARLDVDPVPGPAHQTIGLMVIACLMIGGVLKAGFQRRA